MRNANCRSADDRLMTWDSETHLVLLVGSVPAMNMQRSPWIFGFGLFGQATLDISNKSLTSQAVHGFQYASPPLCLLQIWPGPDKVV